MRFYRAFPFAMALALAAPACGGSSDCSDPNTPGCVVASSKERITSPAVSADDQKAAVKGNTAFALDLYQAVRGQKGNLFYSPFSISEALAMTWAGARNETATQMAATLHFTLPQATLHPAFDAIDLALASRGKGAEGDDGKAFRLTIANALWGQTGYTFATPFLDTLGQNYGAGMHVVDFRGASDGALQIINDWVSEKTEKRIQKLLGPGSVDGDTKLVLTNAVYFNAAWATAFEASATKTGTFTRDDGSKVEVPLMSGDQETGYAEGDGYAAVELPYDGGELSMVLILPAPGQLDAFESALTPDRLETITGALESRDVAITMPRFHIEASFDLADTLAKMGMPIAFTGEADFSAISTDSRLQITDVVHKAYVDVNEAGTEAAAATAVVLGDGGLAGDPAQIRLDHPFLVLIRDLATGTVLFVGRVADPS